MGEGADGQAAPRRGGRGVGTGPTPSVLSFDWPSASRLPIPVSRAILPVPASVTGSVHLGAEPAKVVWMSRLRMTPTAFLLASLAIAAPAQAQYRGNFMVAKPATGETYHVEARIGLWSPSPNIVVSTDSLGPLGNVIFGDQIDAVTDLGFTSKRFPDFHLLLRPAKKHKFYADYIPIRYSAQTTLERDVVFGGTTFHVGVPVSSSLDWNAYRFGYEYDFLYHSRWFVGFIADVKYTNAKVALDTPVTNQSAAVRLPLPAIGGVVRVYPTSNVSITAEVTGFKLPERINPDYKGRYVDYDLYVSANFSDHYGAQTGYRSLSLNYLVKKNSGAFALKGWYFGFVARF
jgi:hypothetical protein